MEYKALFLDLDGTTIPNSEHGLPSKKVAEAIAKASKYVRVCAATSRPLFMAQPIIEAARFTGPCVLNTGAVIYDPVSRRILKEYTLDTSLVPRLFGIMKSFKVKVVINDTKREYIYHGGHLPKRAYNLFTYEMKPQMADKLVKMLKKTPAVAIHKMPAWKKGYVCIEATNPQVSKLHGIVEVAKMLKIDTHQMIGVGDGYNDFPLLMACGLKIAMGNAVPELKAIADFIAPTVEDDGVVTVIEKFILSS